MREDTMKGKEQTNEETKKIWIEEGSKEIEVRGKKESSKLRKIETNE